MPRESWVQTYLRILHEVEADMPNADRRTIYAEYRSRVEAWKHEKGRR